MKKLILAVTVFGASVLMTGCNTTGLSLREEGNNNFGSLLYSLVDDHKTSTVEPLEVPLKLAVIQVGEITPPTGLINTLRGSSLISQVIPIPAQADGQERLSVAHVKKMMTLSKNLGADYVFLFGGMIDSGYTNNWLTVLDVATLGFVIPSNEIQAQGSVAGALVNTHTGEVVFTVSDTAQLTSRASFCLVDGAQQRIHVRMRDALIVKITKAFLARLNQHTAHAT